MLTAGTMTSPANMENAPALMGDCKNTGNALLKNMFAVISVVLNRKQHQIEALLAFFQYSP